MGALPQAKRFGPYEIVGRLGFGGMGIVLDARSDDGKAVALKLLRPTGDAHKHKVFAARFHREAKILQKLSHPGVVRLLDSGSIHGIFFLAMERIDGKSLGVLLKRAPMDAEAIIVLGIKLGETLAHLHEIGIVHRDIKPDNVIVNTQGVPILTDFGLARLSGGTAITRANELVGSLGYIAPEVIEGAIPSPKSDQYALGRLLFNLAAKRSEESNEGLPLLQALQKSMKLDWSTYPNEGGAFARLAEVINRMVARDPEQRFPDMYSLIVELDTLTRAFCDAETGTAIDAFPTDKHQVAKPRSLTQSSAPPESEVQSIGQRNWEDDTRWDPDAEKKLTQLAAQLSQPARAPWLASDLSAPAALPQDLEWVRPASDQDFLGLSGALALGRDDLSENEDDAGANVIDTMDMMVKLRRRRALPYSVIEAPPKVAPAAAPIEPEDKSDRIAQLKKQTQQFWSQKLNIADTMPPLEPPPESAAEELPEAIEAWKHIVDDLGPPPDGATVRMPAVKSVPRFASPVKIPAPVEALEARAAAASLDRETEPEAFRPLIPYPRVGSSQLGPRPVPIAPSVLMEEQIATLPPDAKKEPVVSPLYTPSPGPRLPRRYGVLIAALIGAFLVATVWVVAGMDRGPGPARYEGDQPPNASQLQLAGELHREAEKALRSGDRDKAQKLYDLCVRTADLEECKKALESLATGLSQSPR
jgi:serine/threonine protein kinase